MNKHWIRLSKKDSLDFIWKNTSLNNNNQLSMNDLYDYNENYYIKFKTNCKYWDGILYIDWYSWKVYYNPFTNSIRLYITGKYINYKSYKILKLPNPIILFNKDIVIEKVKIGHYFIEPSKIFKYE